MILPEDAPSSPLKDQHQPLLPPQQPPPPSYNAATIPQPGGPGPASNSGPHSQQAYYHHVQTPPQRSGAGRFFKAFAVAIFVWLLLVIFAESVNYSVGNHWGFDWVGGYDIPPRVALTSCVHGKNNKALVVTEKIRLDDALLLIARGSQIGGHAEIVTSPALKDEAQFDIVATFHGSGADDLAARTKICKITRDDGELGMGLFTPRQAIRLGRRNVRFDIRVQLPEGITIPKFTSDLPNHAYKVGDIVDTIAFDELLLKGTNQLLDVTSLRFTEGVLTTTNAKIYAGLLKTEKAVISTTNGPIDGEFHSNKSLTLTATNGAITSKIKMVDNDNGLLDLQVLTTNDKIDATISLLSDARDSSNFKVLTATTNGKLFVDIADLPVDAKLRYSGTTTNSPAEVKIPSTFEGKFEAMTTNGRMNVNVDEHTADPSGRGRYRSAKTLISSRWSTSGTVHWGTLDESDHDGSVLVFTTNSNVALQL